MELKCYLMEVLIFKTGYSEMNFCTEVKTTFGTIHKGFKVVYATENLSAKDKVYIKFLSPPEDLNSNTQLILNALAEGYDEEKIYDL